MPWKLNKNIGKTATKLGELTVDASRPDNGLVIGNDNFAGALFMGLGMSASHTGTPLEVDPYSRDADLVATYAASNERPLRYQLYWRMIDHASPDVLMLWELIASVQTPLLDSDPTLIVQTHLNDVTSILYEDCRSVVRHPLGTYFELSHPRDYRDTTFCWNCDSIEIGASKNPVSKSGSASLHHSLFARSLEKGVILRSRLRGGWLAPNAKPALIEELFSEFANSEPVLTT